MGFFRGAKKVLGGMFNTDVRGWVGYDNVKREFDSTLDMAQNLITPEVTTHPETFEEAIARLKLTEDDLKRQVRAFKRNIVIFACFSLGLLAYAFWNLYTKHFQVSLVVFCLMFYTLAQAFRFHFWVFQIEQRRLGCTFKEWLNHYFGA